MPELVAFRAFDGFIFNKSNIGSDDTIPKKDKIKMVESWFNEKAKSKNIDLKLRK